VNDDRVIEEALLPVRIAAFHEVRHGRRGEFAVLDSEHGPVVVVVPPAPPDWSMSRSADGSVSEPTARMLLVAAVRGLRPALRAVGWIRVEPAGAVEMILEDLSTGIARRLWTDEVSSGHWDEEGTSGILA